MKQESGFHPALRSSAGATGAMQLMPSTARWLNKKLRIKKMNPDKPKAIPFCWVPSFMQTPAKNTAINLKKLPSPTTPAPEGSLNGKSRSQPMIRTCFWRGSLSGKPTSMLKEQGLITIAIEYYLILSQGRGRGRGV